MPGTFNNLYARGGIRLIKMEFPQYPPLQLTNFGGGYNSEDVDLDIANNELSGGQNIIINPDMSIAKRVGHTLYGNYIGNTTGILGLVAHEPPGGTQEILAAYDTQILRNVSGVWTPLTGVTMTTNLPIDSCFNPWTNKTYIVNGTDNVVKYTSGTSADQTDAAFIKGKYITYYQDRMLVAQGNKLYWSDSAVDTFPGLYNRAVNTITGVEVLYDKLMTFTKRAIYLTSNFSWDSVADVSSTNMFTPLKTDFGAIYDRTIKKVGNLLFFMGQSTEGVASVYVTDASSVSIISEKIRNDLNTLTSNDLINACASTYGRYYRISVTPGGQTTNKVEYLYDTIARRWLPPFTNTLGGFSCYVASETAGKLDIYAGTQNDGRVYKLSQPGINYDEGIDQSFMTSDTDSAVDGNPAKRGAQSFQVSSALPRSRTITGLALKLKKNAGTTTGLTVRIETDNSGPSGTLADPSLTGTISAFTSTTYGWYTVSFNPTSLNSSQTYWIVLQHTTEGSGTSQYYWGQLAAGGYMNNANYASGWTAGTASNDFILFGEEPIDAFADTKAFVLSPEGQESHLEYIYVNAASEGNWNLQVGVNPGTYGGFISQDMPLQGNAPLIGSTYIIGESILGNAQTSPYRLRYNGVRGKSLKFRFRNQNDNEPFVVYSLRTMHRILGRFK